MAEPTLYQLWMIDPARYQQAAQEKQLQMLNYWRNHFVSVTALLTAELPNEELTLLDHLFDAAFGIPAAIGPFATAHNLAMGDPQTPPVLVRMALFYGYLLGKGLLAPPPPPASEQDLVQMMEIWQQEQQLKLTQAGNRMKGKA